MQLRGVRSGKVTPPTATTQHGVECEEDEHMGANLDN